MNNTMETIIQELKKENDTPAREKLFKELLDVQGKSVRGELGLANVLDEIEAITDFWRVIIKTHLD